TEGASTGHRSAGQLHGRAWAMVVTDEWTQRQRFGRRLMDATNGAFDVATAYLGIRLGLYRSLADNGPATSAELAARTGTNERLVREWLEQQAATEVLEASHEPGGWRFALPPDHAAVLLDPDGRLSGRSARILDVGCGLGWSSIGIARALGGAHVDGVDLDPASILAARSLAAAHGLKDRVSFEVRDAASLAGAGYDLAT